MPQSGLKSRVTCFCTAAATFSRSPIGTSWAIDTMATCSVRGTGRSNTCTATARYPRILIPRHLDRLAKGRARSRRDMMLDQSQIAHYLLSLGVLEPRAIVED